MIGISICKQWQTWTYQPSSPSVNLYIAELRMLFGGDGTMKVQCSASQPESPQSKKVAKYGINTWSLRNNKNAMFNEATRNSSCQFVYCGSLGVICRTQNNRDSIFSPAGHEPTIKKCLSMEWGIRICSIKSHVHNLYRDSFAQVRLSICISRKCKCYL